VVHTSDGKQHEARFVIDASGHGALLGSRVGRKENVESLKKVAFFSHYRNVPREEGREGGNTVVVILRDAWFWLIPLSDDVMSVGLVLNHGEARGADPQALLDQTIARTPYMAERMRQAEQLMPVRARRDFSYRISSIAGENYVMAGDASGFLDPIFSTGVLLAMQSAERAADAVAEKLERGSMAALRRYERDSQTSIDRYFRFIERFYSREFLEVFLAPDPPRGFFLPIVRVLGGNVFSSRMDRIRLALFFAIVKLQKRWPVAPRIEWDALPSAASV
jgi:flavin-dependent dehydrogenase